LENFLPLLLQTTGMQVLESVYIINNSSNIDTIISRQKFLQEKYGDLLLNQNNSDYLSIIQIAINSYTERYYDRPLQEVQLAIVRNPSVFELTDFFIDSLINSLKRISVKQTEEINLLKSAAAKQKRIDKVLQTFLLVKNEIVEKFSTGSDYRNALNELEKLEIGFKP
jgi:hypothetical protein